MRVAPGANGLGAGVREGARQHWVARLLAVLLVCLLAGCAANKPPEGSTLAPPVAADAAPSAETARTRDFKTGEAPYAVVKVFYATDRAKTGDSAPNSTYGPARGKLAFGIADVSIPRDHRMGHLETPAISQLEFRENPEQHVVLLAGAGNAHAPQVARRLAADGAHLVLIGDDVAVIEAVHAIEQAGPEAASVGTAMPSHVPTVGGNVADRIASRAQQLPECLRIGRAGQPASQADDRQRLRARRLHLLDALAHAAQRLQRLALQLGRVAACVGHFRPPSIAPRTSCGNRSSSA